MNKTIIIAHRGVSELAPENTMPALEMSIDLNCHGIEFDVHLSKDGIPVIVHDETIDRTSMGNGLVRDYTLRELKTFDFGIKFSPNFSGTLIPSLEEFFQLARTKNFKGIINVELKNDIEDYPYIEEKVLTLIDTYQFNQQALISSFNHKSIKHVRKISPNIKIALLYDKNETPSLEDLKEVKAYSANIEFQGFSKEILKTLQKNNINLFCYTINPKETIKKYINYGVNGIFTNNPI